ncbi:MAG: DNA polymerase III subunit alpha [Gammaproteobacteria bacterium]|nr:DNA polymerase III subunit alpha [Gammaproteobacteria bacterium]
MTPTFIHLRNHSEFSLVDGLLRFKPWMEQLKKLHMPAVALTDESNLFAVVKYYKAAMAAGIKPIFGADLWLENSAAATKPFRVTALCQNDLGYKHLRLLVSAAYQSGQHHDKAIIKYSHLEQWSQGLIIIACAGESDIAHALLQTKNNPLEAVLSFWQKHFPNRFYLEIQRVGKAHEAQYNPAIIELALAKNLPLVATNDVRFLMPSDFDAHEARVCIHEGEMLVDSHRPQRYTEEQYVKNAAEMAALFSDIPQALANTVEIAKRCNVSLKLGESFLPAFPVPGGMTENDYLTAQSIEGLNARLQKTFPDISLEQRRIYDQRLQIELQVINKMGFPGYFLIVADFIQWAKNNDIPVGPGRGSGAGSLVAYVLGITDLDPLVHDLLFERFLNPERVSMPDFDIDFCMEGRDRVIEYVAQKYGRQSVAQIITFGTMAARAVVRDVGRVLGLSYGFVDKIAKLIPFEIGMTLEKALQDEPLLLARYEQEDDTRQLIDLGKTLEGVARNAGKHAGGVVISPTTLVDFTAIYCEQDAEQLITQLDKDDVEAVGLVKFDFLGLRTLTIIQWALRMVNTKRKTLGEPPVDITTLPIDDKKTYDLLLACQTHAVFQLESRGMRDLIKRLQPDCFEEIVALVALFRPGPLQSGMVDDFINRKHGRAVVEYPHPDLIGILKPTYGVIVYQEQVMQIAQVLAGYTLGGADILRRAMGKKKAEEMAEQRAIFIAGSLARNVDYNVANGVFDLMEKFAGYGFNRSHSAAYALIAYQTAWLKAHYPAALMAAVLSSDMDNTDKIVLMVNEVKAMRVSLSLPNLNQGFYSFTLDDQGGIIYGLGAIKGVGEAAIELIVAERNLHGPYQDLFSFCQRVDLQKCNRRVIEALIKSGAMDVFAMARGRMLASVDSAIQLAEKTKRDRAYQQFDLFSQSSATALPKMAYAQHNPWNERARLIAEKAVLGWYASGHPVLHYAAELKYMTTTTLAKLQAKYARASSVQPAKAPSNGEKPAYSRSKGEAVTIAGVIIALRTMNTKRGDRMAFVTLDDGETKIELAVFADLYAQHREDLAGDNLIIVSGEVSWDDNSNQLRMRAQTIQSLEQARINYAKGILLRLPAAQLMPEKLRQLEKILLPHCGGLCPVYIDYIQENNNIQILMGEKWKVTPRDVLVDSLCLLLGENAVSVGY